MADLGDQLESMGVLAEPARRALYQHVVSSPEPVSREQAAEALGLAVHNVKFHLDKLAAVGLLEVEYRRLSGRSGPGAGRPSKVYRRTDREVAVSVPPRRYDLAGEVLAEAVDRSVRDGVPVGEAVVEVAREVGRDLIAAADDGVQRAPSAPPDEVSQVADVLTRYGYEPQRIDDELCLANCPFDRLALQHTSLVCGMNVALVDGVLDGVGAETLQARLAPREGFCCVTVGQA